MEKNKVICIVQADILPQDFLENFKKINSKLTVLEFLIERLKKSELISKIVVACSENRSKIIKLCQKKISYFIGSKQTY